MKQRNDLIMAGLNTQLLCIDTGDQISTQVTQDCELICLSDGEIHPDGYNMVIKSADRYYMAMSIDFEL